MKEKLAAATVLDPLNALERSPRTLVNDARAGSSPSGQAMLDGAQSDIRLGQSRQESIRFGTALRVRLRFGVGDVRGDVM